MKCLAIGGLPATGKTTLMRNILNILRPDKKLRYGLLRGYICENDISIMGVYERGDVFAGTDKLSMAVQRDFTEYVHKTKRSILFEGDRLFTANNLLLLKEKYKLKIIVLTNDTTTLHQRHADRKDKQTEKFIKGRQTKISNICADEYLSAHIQYRELNTYEESKALAKEITDWL